VQVNHRGDRDRASERVCERLAMQDCNHNGVTADILEIQHMNPRCVIPIEDLMSRPSRSRLRWKSAMFAGALLAAATSLATCSGEPQSLADYIATLCAASFRSAPPDEAPFLAENVSAMTKMTIDMGIRPSGDVDNDFVAMMIPHHQARSTWRSRCFATVATRSSSG
jgi:hypothetical protein